MRRRKQLVGVLALTAALAIVPTAQAKPNEFAGNDRAHNEIPYLSQGIGVNAEDFGGSASAAQPSVEIPYLSQGVGVDEESFRGTGPATQRGIGVDDRALPRGPAVEPPPIVVTRDSGRTVDLGDSYIAALALMLGVLAGGTLVAMWSNRRTKLSPA